MMSRKAVARAVAVIIATATAPATAGDEGRPHALRYVMGTWCDLVLLDDRADNVAVEAAFREIARLERILSNWDPESEISRINAAAGQGERPVSVDVAAVMERALTLCESTGGAFDASVGSLVHAWGFDGESPARPSTTRIQEAAKRVGCDRARVRLDPPSIALAHDTRLDLGGIGKGYAVDRALAVLHALGVRRAKIDLGSSSLGLLGRIDGGWPIVVADPRDRERPLLSFRVSEGAVSSSGQRERSFLSNRHRYGHIFDPRRGVPVESRLLLVTVVAPEATLADGLSTALFVMGADRGRPVVERLPGVGAVFVEDAGKGEVMIRTIGVIDRLTRLSR